MSAETLDLINKVWPLIVGLGTMIGTFFTIYGKIVSIDVSVKSQVKMLEDLRTDYRSLSVRVSELEQNSEMVERMHSLEMAVAMLRRDRE